MVGGLGVCGIPEPVKALLKTRVRDLRVVSSDMGWTTSGRASYWDRAITRSICCYMGENSLCQSQSLSGEQELELPAQGSLAERIRAGVAGAGVPAFYTASRTVVQEEAPHIRYAPFGSISITSRPREVRECHGSHCPLQRAIAAGSAGRRVEGQPRRKHHLRKKRQEFQRVHGQSWKTSVVEVEEIVGMGTFAPEAIHVPNVYVDPEHRGECEKGSER